MENNIHKSCKDCAHNQVCKHASIDGLACSHYMRIARIKLIERVNTSIYSGITIDELMTEDHIQYYLNRKSGEIIRYLYDEGLLTFDLIKESDWTGPLRSDYILYNLRFYVVAKG